MNKFGDFNKLIQFCQKNSISIEINYWETSNELELRTVSPAKAECFYMKRTPNIDYFIEKWEENLKEQLAHEQKRSI